MKKIIAFAATLISVVALAAPATAATPSSDSDVRFMTSLMKDVWLDLDYEDHDAICSMYYISPRFTRNEMADEFHNPYDGALSEYSLYDVRRAVWRLLKWAC
jgi:hypothetical protein